MNCDSWEDIKNSLTTLMTGRALINLFGVRLSMSIMLIRSLIILSIRASPTLNLF